jgi:predicted membrane-bound spermidine synthase
MFSVSNLKGVADLFKFKKGSRFVTEGTAVLTKFKFSHRENPLYNMRLIRDGQSLFTMYDGEYVRLVVDGELMMSDTNMEKLSNEEFVANAHGHVLIAGLGIGLVLWNIMGKMESGEVKSVTILEKSADVIKLVGKKFRHRNIKILNADVFEWVPPAGAKYDVIYFDIWPNVSSDNLPEMTMLHRRFNKYLSKQPKAWMGSWMRDYTRRMKRKGVL